MRTPQIINVREEMSDLIPGRTYATHGIDRYPAKMIPHLARFAIQRCSQPGQSILDPFCGCGTVLVESRIARRRATGTDINPLALLLARAKSYLYRENILNMAIFRVAKAATTVKVPSTKLPPWVDYWFNPATLRQLLSLRDSIENSEGELSPAYVCALRAILAVTVRLSSKADPRSPKPFISRKARRERVGRNFDAFQIFLDEGRKFMKAAAEFRTLVSDGRSSPIRVLYDDARRLERNARIGSFDAIVTSPPYLSAQDYYRSSKLEIVVLGLMTEKQLRGLGPALIGSGRGSQDSAALEKLNFLPQEIEALYKLDSRSANTVATFLNDIAVVISGCYKHLRHDGYCCLIIGDSTIRTIKLPMHTWIIKIAGQAGFLLKEHFVDTVRSRRVPPQRHGHTSVIGQEHILIFAKPIGMQQTLLR